MCNLILLVNQGSMPNFRATCNPLLREKKMSGRKKKIEKIMIFIGATATYQGRAWTINLCHPSQAMIGQI